jgi:hypothetical protein
MAGRLKKHTVIIPGIAYPYIERKFLPEEDFMDAAAFNKEFLLFPPGAPFAS